MRCVLTLALLLVIASGGTSSTQPRTDARIRHLGFSPRDQLVECVQLVFAKRVIRSPEIPQFEPPPKCSTLSRVELIAALKGQTVTVIENSDTALLESSLVVPPYDPNLSELFRVKWKEFRLVVSARRGKVDSDDADLNLSPAEMSQLTDEVLRSARLVPVRQTVGESLDVPTATFPIRLDFYVRRLKPGAPASVIVIIRNEGSNGVYDEDNVPGRVVYGESQAQGGFKLMWDSPLFVARHLSLTFEDVDRDGFDDLNLRGGIPGGMRGDSSALTAFNRLGRELTRAASCEQPKGHDFWRRFDTCPVIEPNR